MQNNTSQGKLQETLTAFYINIRCESFDIPDPKSDQKNTLTKTKSIGNDIRVNVPPDPAIISYLTRGFEEMLQSPCMFSFSCVRLTSTAVILSSKEAQKAECNGGLACGKDNYKAFYFDGQTYSFKTWIQTRKQRVWIC